MKVTSKVDAVDEWVCCEEIPLGYDNSLALQEKEVVLQDPAISVLRSYQACACGLFIIDTEMAFTRPVQDHYEVTGDSIMLGFYLDGDATADVTGFGNRKKFSPNTQYICYTPHFEAVYKMPPHRRHHYFLVILSREFYFRLMHQQSFLHKEFAAQVLQGQHTYLNSEPMEITAEMKWVIHDIRNCQRNPALKRLYIEAKVAELLVLQLEQWHNKLQPRQSVLRGDDQERIAEARAILEKNFVNPPNIQELARLVYLNEHKLKQGFKACCNHTVHGYVVWLRMQKAKQLLKQSQRSIGDIAYEVGYKNAAHFTAAFKKHFGFLPSEIKIRE